MFDRLTYRAKFSNGRELKGDFTFSSGLTAIFGANESGKSFSLEMLRFGLFGSGALRGKNSDYDMIDMSMTFKVRDEAYALNRTLKKATMMRGGEVIATGTTAVNDKCVQVLGFGLAVFDVACAANQGDLERLSSMPPTERKRMVDSVIGLGALDQVATWASSEALLREKEAAGVRSMLREPIQPVKPDGYEASELLQPKLDELSQLNTELMQLRGWLQVEHIEPVEPQLTPEIVRTAECLDALAVNKRRLVSRQATLKASLSALPAFVMSEEDIQAAEDHLTRYSTYEEAQAFLRRHPAPVYALTDLKAFEEAWTAIEQAMKRDALKERIFRLRLKGTRPCPHCKEEIPLEQDTIAEVQAQLDLIPEVQAPAQPPINRAALTQQVNLWTAFLPVQEQYRIATGVGQVEPPRLSGGQLAVARAQRDAFLRGDALRAELAEIEAKIVEEDFDALLVQRRVYDRSLKAYERVKAVYDAWVALRDQRVEREAALAPVPGQLEAIRDQVNAARAYEGACAVYQALLESWTEGQARANELESNADQYRRVKAALVALRVAVKQHLLPSLNYVASRLLDDMTGGQRTSIHVDDEFNILVDGQSVDTLSGSGKACANLALRLGLSRVLTNNVLSVFLADEIDSSMDQFRAGETSRTLRALQKTISQIILVSHKPVEADHVFELSPVQV